MFKFQSREEEFNFICQTRCLTLRMSLITVPIQGLEEQSNQYFLITKLNFFPEPIVGVEEVERASEGPRRQAVWLCVWPGSQVRILWWWSFSCSLLTLHLQYQNCFVALSAIYVYIVQVVCFSCCSIILSWFL